MLYIDNDMTGMICLFDQLDTQISITPKGTQYCNQPFIAIYIVLRCITLQLNVSIELG